jgi:hypothetical protein
MKILIEFEKVKTLIDFQDLLENLDACELPYTIKKAPLKWSIDVGFADVKFI